MDSGERTSKDKREAGEICVPIPVRQRVADAEASTRPQQDAGDDVPAKFVRFDSETAEIAEPTRKQPRTALYSPVYTGNLESSPATSSNIKTCEKGD